MRNEDFIYSAIKEGCMSIADAVALRQLYFSDNKFDNQFFCDILETWKSGHCENCPKEKQFNPKTKACIQYRKCMLCAYFLGNFNGGICQYKSQKGMTLSNIYLRHGCGFFCEK